MEELRKSSEYQFSYYNTGTELISNASILLLGLYVYSQIRKFYRNIIKNLQEKERNESNQMNIIIIKLTINLLGMLYYFLLFYLVITTSFHKIRHRLFSIFNNTTQTHSNLRDLGSFKIFYCSNDSPYKSYNEDDVTFTTFDNKISALCWKHSILDSLIIEYVIIFTLFFFDNLEFVTTSYRENPNRSRLTLLLIYYFCIMIYFVRIYFTLIKYGVEKDNIISDYSSFEKYQEYNKNTEPVAAAAAEVISNTNTNTSTDTIEGSNQSLSEKIIWFLLKVLEIVFEVISNS